MVPTLLRELENRHELTWIGPVLTEALGANPGLVKGIARRRLERVTGP